MRWIPVFVCLFLFAAGLRAQSPPALGISLVSPQVARVSWPASAADWNLTWNGALTTGAWLPVTAATVNQGAELAVLLPVADSHRFFRLERNCQFRATPPVIAAGGSSVLTWCERPGVTYQVFPGPAGPVTGGRLTVSPTVTTNYVLLATEGENVTTSFAMVSVAGGNLCAFANLSGWDGTLNFSYERTPSHGEWSFMIRQEAHLSFHLTRTALIGNTAEFTGHVTGNAQLNDRAEEAGTPPNVRTVIGSGAPQTDATDDRVSRLTLTIDCQANTYSFVITPAITATAVSASGTTTGLWGVGKVDVRGRALPQTVGALSGNQMLPARGPTWTGNTDHYHPGGLGDVMFITGTVNDESAGSASVNWSFNPAP
jgi:hypothetical protein